MLFRKTYIAFLRGFPNQIKFSSDKKKKNPVLEKMKSRKIAFFAEMFPGFFAKTRDDPLLVLD